VATFENSVMIRRPTEEVFAFLADFENIPQVELRHRRDPQDVPGAHRRGDMASRPRRPGR
jgi:hypothetical protein